MRVGRQPRVRNAVATSPTLVGRDSGSTSVGNTHLGGVLLFVLLVPGHLGSYLVERAAIAALIALLVIRVATTRQVPLPQLRVAAPPLVLVALLWGAGVIYTGATLWHQGHEPQWQELGRFPTYLALFALLLILSANGPVRATRWAVRTAIFYSAGVLLVLRLDLPLLGSVADFLYGATKMRWNAESGTRFSAPFENPNYLAFFLVVGAAYLFATERVHGDDAVAGRIAMFVAGGLLALTGSRSGYIAGMVALLSLLAVTVHRWLTDGGGGLGPRKRRRRVINAIVLIAGLALVALAAPLVAELQSSRLDVLEQLATAGADSGASRLALASIDASVSGRLSNWQGALSALQSSPVIGTGAWASEIVDSQFLIWAARVGLVGTAAILAFWGYLIVGALRGDRCRDARWSTWVIVVPAIVMLAAGAFVSNFRLFFFLASLMLSLAVVDPAREDVREQLL